MRGVGRAAADEVVSIGNGNGNDGNTIIMNNDMITQAQVQAMKAKEASAKQKRTSARRKQEVVDGEWMNNCGPVMEQFRFGREASFNY